MGGGSYMVGGGHGRGITNMDCGATWTAMQWWCGFLLTREENAHDVYPRGTTVRTNYTLQTQAQRNKGIYEAFCRDGELYLTQQRLHAAGVVRDRED